MERKSWGVSAQNSVYESCLPYIIEGNVLIIIAIAHNARHPDYWKKRIS